MLEFEFEFARGEFLLQAQARIEAGATGICGPSGCGKSTLLALLAGLLQPRTGKLSFRGEAIVDCSTGTNVPAWRRHFALVFQDGQLFPHLTVQDNLLYGYRRRASSERRFERQRVALGRALLYSPRLLLLDEPLAALDDRLKQQILPFLHRVKETGLPMIYVSHARAEVEYLADRTFWMEHGRLA
jgi:molybdate transport system ATP-binding protein